MNRRRWIHERCAALYRLYNRPEYIDPDPPAVVGFVLTRFRIRPGFFEEVVAEFGENPYTPYVGC